MLNDLLQTEHIKRRFLNIGHLPNVSTVNGLDNPRKDFLSHLGLCAEQHERTDEYHHERSCAGDQSWNQLDLNFFAKNVHLLVCGGKPRLLKVRVYPILASLDVRVTQPCIIQSLMQ
ncbi:hypothetical protein DSECCO2_461700 [anaerobic digester metagenome]